MDFHYSCSYWNSQGTIREFCQLLSISIMIIYYHTKKLIASKSSSLIISINLDSISKPQKTWIFPFPQYIIIEIYGCMSLWERTREPLLYTITMMLKRLFLGKGTWFLLKLMCLLSHSVMSDPLRSYGLWTTSLCLWDSPRKNTGVDFHLILQGIFSTQGWTHISHVSFIGRWVLYH